MSRQPRDAGDAAVRIIETLRGEGHVALLAGGCVRDRLLSREPKDYDVVTDAIPSRVKEIYPKAREVGAKFGVMLVRQFGHEIEVATFRADGPYSDGRHPDAVRFGSMEEDAKRRDFTVNGMFFDPAAGCVIDLVGGQDDLSRQLLRTIGDPQRRFAEDHLRMLRAVRFAARLGFDIDPGTIAAIQRHAVRLRDVSAERVWQELEAILTDPTRARGFQLLVETKLRDHLAVSVTLANSGDEDARIERRLTALSPHSIQPSLALATVLCGRSGDQVKAVCADLRLSNRLSQAVRWLVGRLPLLAAERELEQADLRLFMANENWTSLIELLRADLTASGSSLEPHDRVRDRVAAVPSGEAVPPPLLNGDDLLAMGIEPGKRMGVVLDALYRAQLNGRIVTRDEATALLQELMASS